MSDETPITTTAPQLRTFGTEDALAFLNGTGVDAAGRTVADYLQFDMDKWEECHNHVQWAFPSHIMSRFNPEAPVVDMYELVLGLGVQGYRNLSMLIDAYLRSLGFTRYMGQWKLDENSPRKDIWRTPHNHNYQRITRLLNLLSWTDRELAMELMVEFILAAHSANRPIPDADGTMTDVVTVNTIVFWTIAATGKL